MAIGCPAERQLGLELMGDSKVKINIDQAILRELIDEARKTLIDCQQQCRAPTTMLRTSCASAA